ncbi:MAG TPA: hypothetical protein VM141_01135 [Planctomycetota bacterium]|nr:hypothetical protein [Planctomycetota bacterium]
MILSKREKYIAAGTLIGVAIFLLDSIIFTPLLEQRAAMAQEKQSILYKLERARLLFARKKKIEPQWNQTLAGGLNMNAAQAESNVLHAVRKWAQESSLTMNSVRPERVAKKSTLQEITFQAVGTGTMSAVAGFLWRLESATLPVRVASLQLGARKEGTDDLTLQLRISALCQSAEVPAGEHAASAAPEDKDDE